MLLSADKEYDVASNPVLKFVRRHLPVTEKLEGDHFVVRKADDYHNPFPALMLTGQEGTA